MYVCAVQSPSQHWEGGEEKLGSTSESRSRSPRNHNRQDFSLGRNIVNRLNVIHYQGSI